MRHPREPAALMRIPKSPRGNASSYAASYKNAQEDPMYAAELQRDVAAREARLQMLRAEVVERDREIEELTQRNRDAAVKLMDVSGRLDTMSMKVETVAGNRAGVLKASAQTGGGKTSMLRRWLAKMEWDLTEKDEEIAKLRTIAYQGVNIVHHQQAECDNLMQQRWRQEEQAAFIQEEERRVKRHHAIEEWAVNVKAKIDRENADVINRRHRRAFADQLLEVTEANQTLRAFILRMQDKCKDLMYETEATRRKQEALMVTERVSTSTAKLGHAYKGEALMDGQADLSELRRQVQQEQRRTQSARVKATDYNQKEFAMMHGQMELMSLTACLREINRALANKSLGTTDDAVDKAVTELVESLQDYGMAVPPLLRIGPSEYLCGGELVQCTLRGGSLYVRPSETASMTSTMASPNMSPRGNSLKARTPVSATVAPHMSRSQDMVPISEFLRSRALQPLMTAGIPAMSRQSIAPALPTFSAPFLGSPQETRATKGLAGLVAPLMISARNPMMA